MNADYNNGGSQSFWERETYIFVTSFNEFYGGKQGPKNLKPSHSVTESAITWKKIHSLATFIYYVD